MSEKEKRIIETITKAVESTPSDQNMAYLLGWAEGMAFSVCGPQTAAERPGA